MYWQRKRVLITGIAGLIGAPLAKMLLDQGAHVMGLDLEFPGCLKHYAASDRISNYRVDITDRAEMRRAVEATYPDVIFHLAAISHVENSRAKKAVTFDVNVGGVLNVLEAANDRTRVVVASSNHIYGAQETTPTPEDAPFRQLDTYSASKTMADYLARAYHHNYGKNVVVIRNTNCFGPHDPHTDHIVPSTILSVAKGEAPVIRSQGLVRKGFLYVDDVARAYMLLAEKGEAGEAYNVSSELSYSARDIVATILKVMGSDMKFIVQGQPNDQKDEFLDWSKARALGWEPKETLQSAIEKTVKGFVKETIYA